MHHVRVRAFAQRLLGDENAAEDLVQDTFVALPRLIGRFRGESSLCTFLISVAANQSRHHLRSAIRRRQAYDRSSAVAIGEAQTPEDQLQQRQLADVLTRALDALPYEQRLAVVLCEVEERTAADAARIVGVPEGTIRTRVFHGKRKLRDALTRRGLR
jgi:RNA polymerase sigma-70 factor (ECF subfamily)